MCEACESELDGCDSETEEEIRQFVQGEGKLRYIGFKNGYMKS